MIGRLLRTCFWLLALLILSWWVVNRFDQAPTSEATRLAEPFVDTLADADNAWIFLLGMDAAEDADPVELGRSRLDAYEHWVNSRPRPRRDALVDELFRPQLRVLRPDPEQFGVDHWCPITAVDCIDWVAARGQMLFRLTAPNLPLLHRFLAALDMPRLQELATPHHEAPVIDFEIAEFVRNLLAQEMISPTLGPPAVQELARTAAFWRRVFRQARSMQLRRHASHHLEMSRRLFDQAMNREWFDAEAYDAETLSALLDPPTEEERDWSEQIRHDFQSFDRTMAGEAVGSFRGWRQCRRDGEGGCTQSLFYGQAYAHQATLNLRARIDLWTLDALHAHPTELESVLARGSVLWDEISPWPDSITDRLGRLAYNITGRTLVTIIMPTLQFVWREHDREALRRMLAIKYGALRSGIRSQDMTEHLDRQPPTLRDPLTGEAFGWDPVREEMRHLLTAPGSSGAFLRMKLATRANDAPAIEVCATPWWIQLSMAYADPDFDSPRFERLARFAACGVTRGVPAWVEVESMDGDDAPFWDVVADTARTDGDPANTHERSWLPLSVYFGHGAQQRHTFLNMSRDSVPGYVELEGSKAMIHQRLLDPPATPLLTLRVRDMRLRDLGTSLRDALARASRESSPRLVGLELLSEAPILTIESDMPLEAVLQHMLYRHNGFEPEKLALQRLEEGGYAFVAAVVDPG